MSCYFLNEPSPEAVGLVPGKAKTSADKKVRAVVVAQLVERLLPIPEVRGLNPVIGKKNYLYIEHLFTVNCVLKRRK